MRVLFVSAELAPLAASGGLGEAVAGLARALAGRGHVVACAVPAHRGLLRHPGCPRLEPAGAVTLGFPDRVIRGRWLAGRLAERLELLALDLPSLYDREALYGPAGADESLRFIALCRAVAERCRAEPPDVLVAHDWHAALSICLLRTLHDRGAAREVGTIQVIHNNAYQGLAPAEAMQLTGLPESLFDPDGLEFFGALSLLKGGVVWADRIVAVSPTYAREIQTAAFGERLDGVYRLRSRRLGGIANGIDDERFDPARDPALPAHFDAGAPAGRRVCRDKLIEELGLEAPGHGRLCAAIGRFSLQKGWDVLVAAIGDLVRGGARLALLGDGDEAIARALRQAARAHPRRVHVGLGWDDALSRRLYAGADCVLVPSRFEPCGLVQLLSQRYGALPVAHRTGGLADTIEDGVSGILFDELTPAALVAGVERAAALLGRGGAETVQRRLLALDVSWRRPAERWEALLEEVASEGRSRR